jgi:hypothetical protein
MMNDIQALIDDGSFVPAGVDESGEMTYRVTPLCRERHPDVWQAVMADFNAQIDELWSQGYIDIELGNDPSSDIITITEHGRNQLDSLDGHMHSMLKYIGEDGE